MVALQYVLDAAVEPLDHAVRLRPHRRSEAVLDAEIGAEPVEGVGAGGGAPAQAEEAVGELLADQVHQQIDQVFDIVRSRLVILPQPWGLRQVLAGSGHRRGRVVPVWSC